MNRICVATAKARAYYAIVSRLKKAGLPFSSALPDSDFEQCDLILTTSDEAVEFGSKAMPLEELDENPGIFKGQVISRLSGGGNVLLVGVDPGKRTGLAVFYGETKLAFSTFDSAAAVCSRVGAFATGLPSSRLLVRVGNGIKSMASKLIERLRREVPSANIEVVDESGTSAGSSKMRGVQRDQVAAAKIAFRRGDVISPGTTRTHG